MDRFADPGKVRPLEQPKRLTYYTIGEERWKTTTVWPPAHAKAQSWYLGEQNTLTLEKPGGSQRVDEYRVDFTASTGSTNRWHTNGGVEEVWYGNRASEDGKLLTYTSRPLLHDMEITGQPIADLYLASDHTDCAVFLYLEDVDQNGIARYITEGELRGIDRKLSIGKRIYQVIGPYHSFRKEDTIPLTPGQVVELPFSMMPISALIPAGHRIRIALAGADAETFARIPATGDATYTIHRERDYPSHVVIPVIPAEGERLLRSHPDGLQPRLD